MTTNFLNGVFEGSLSAYAEDHACVPKLLVARCFIGALRRAGTGSAVDEWDSVAKPSLCPWVHATADFAAGG